MHRTLTACATLTALGFVLPAHGTWSIVMADCETKEVAVGTVTCLTGLDLLALVPVVVTGEGAGAVQSAGDFDGIRRPIIFEQLLLGTPPEAILEILSDVAGHQQRQYGIVDTEGGAVTFTGAGAGAWAGGVTGSQGSLRYAIQGNVLTGSCVIEAIEAAILAPDLDVPDRLMLGMQAARAAGGDGRCSCSSFAPTSCGCPPPSFAKAGHIGGMVVARIGDPDDPLCSASGCADGDYLMRLNVPFQGTGSLDPVLQLQVQFNGWRGDLAGRPDAIHSIAAIDAQTLPANGTATTSMSITLLDWQDLPIPRGVVPVTSVVVEHAPSSAGIASIGPVTETRGGTYEVTLTAGTVTGVDRLRITVDDGVRPVVLMPDPSLVFTSSADIDGSGAVDFADLLAVLSAWGPCPRGEGCPEDLDGNGVVEFADLLIVLTQW